MSLPALPPGADTRALTERVNVLIRALNGEVATPAAIAGGTLTLDLRVARAFRVAVDGDLEHLVLRGAPAGALSVCFLELAGTGTAYAQSWPGITWLIGPPVLSWQAGRRDLVGLLSLDGGDWLAVVVGQAY